MKPWITLTILAVAAGPAFAHAIEDTTGSDSGSSIINVVQYYQEHASTYSQIHLDDPGNSDWSGLIQTVVDQTQTSKGRIIFFPGGLYRCLSTIVVRKEAGTPLTFLGVGPGFANGNIEGSVVKYAGTSACLRIVGPNSGVRVRGLQFEGAWCGAGATAVLGDATSGAVNKCSFEDLKINQFHYAFRFDGHPDGMVFKNIRLSNVNRCFFLRHAEGAMIDHIEAEPFYEYVFYLDQCSGLTINNILATSVLSAATKVFVLTGSSSLGRSIEINGVHAEYVNNIAVITIPNVILKNLYYYVESGGVVQDDAFVLAKVSDLHPVNVTIENTVFELTGVSRSGNDIALRTDGTLVDLGEFTAAAAYGSRCSGLRVVNSNLDLAGIPSGPLPGYFNTDYMRVEKTSEGESWVGNQRKVSYDDTRPTYSGRVGDVVWNVQPSPGGYIGWTCTGGANWKGFGKIEP